MNVVPYSDTPRYTALINDDDIFVIEQHASGFPGMRKITVKDFLQPVYDTIRQSLSSIYKFMGSVNTYEDLPVYVGEQTPIPVYNILSGSQAGKNFAWITDHWEQFGDSIDLSNYITQDTLTEILLGYAPVKHYHTQDEIRDLNVIESLTIVKETDVDGEPNIFSVQNTDGSYKQFSIKNGHSGKDSINYRIDGAGSITRNADGSYSPPYMYLQAQKLSDKIESYMGRILISSEDDGMWNTVYPTSGSQWTDESFLQFYIPDNTVALRIRLYPTGTDYSEISDDKILYEQSVSIAQTGPRGFSAKLVKLDADSYVFKTGVDGEIEEPAEIHFSVLLQNTQGDLSWAISSGSQLIKSGISQTFSLSAVEMAAYDHAEVVVVCDGISDYCTVVKLSNGADGSSPTHVICSNEVFSIPINNELISTSAFFSEVEFTGYTGSEEADCIIVNVSNVPRGMAYNISINRLALTMPISTPLPALFGNIDVSIMCGTSLITKSLNWLGVREGASAKSISIESDSLVFKTDSSGTILEPKEIMFVAKRQNISSVPFWSATDGSATIKTGNGDSFKLTATEMGSHKSARIQVICEGYTDSCTVITISDGLSGYSTVQVRLLKRAQLVPDNYAGDIATYTFATAALSFGPLGSDGWSQDIPSGEGDLYAIYASAHGQNATDIINSNEWTTPVILSEEGVMGQNGYNVATVMIYTRGSSKPQVPQNDIAYRFAGGEISGLTEPWSSSVPAGQEDLWVSQATVFSRTDSDVIDSSEWSDPVILSYNGKEGYNTAQIFLYKRSLELPSQYAGGIVQYDFSDASISFVSEDDGWHTAPYTASGSLYIICVSISSRDKVVQINPAQWTSPQLYVIEPNNGTSGTSAANIFIYKRSAGMPQVPQETVEYVFETGEISGLTGGWSQTPQSGTLDLWITQTVAIGNEGSVEILPGRWASPVIIGANGTSGSHGWSSAQVMLFKRSQNQPQVYAGTSVTYTFSTGKAEFAGDDDGWSQDIPDGSDNLYAIVAAAAAQGDSDVIASSEWTEPTLYSVKGSDGSPGQNGYNTATVFIYRRSSIIPGLPQNDVTYTFSTGEISGLPEEWYSSVPAGTEQVWTSQATAFSRSSSDIIESSQWTTPVILAKNGEDTWNITCTNETFTIPTDENGNVLEAFILEISFYGYHGTSSLPVTISNIRGLPYGMTSSIDENRLILSMLQNTPVQDTYGVISVTTTCDGTAFPKYITWSRVKRGVPGEKGDGNNWYQGTILIGESTCTGFAGRVGDCYLNTDTCNVYECITEGDAVTAVWQYKLNIKGDKGESFTVVIESSNGNVVRFNEPFTMTLSCRVYLNTDEITSRLGDWRFRWTRTSEDPVADEEWNSKAKAIGHKQVTITNEDVLGRCVFNCEVNLDDF